MLRESGESFRIAAAALGEPTRFALLQLLVDAPRSVGDLVCRLEIRQPRVSHHLGILLRAGLVCVTRDGRLRRYSLGAHSDPAVAALVRLVRETHEVRPDSREERTPRRERVVVESAQDVVAEPLEDYLL